MTTIRCALNVHSSLLNNSSPVFSVSPRLQLLGTLRNIALLLINISRQPTRKSFLRETPLGSLLHHLLVFDPWLERFEVLSCYLIYPSPWDEGFVRLSC